MYVMATSMSKTVKRRVEKARGALFAKKGICESQGVYSPKIMTTLFDVVVLLSATYACEVWGPDIVMASRSGLEYQILEELHCLFMRMTLWVGKSTPHEIMKHELGREPVLVACIARVLGFRNSLVDKGSQSVLYKSAREACTTYLMVGANRLVL
jgi:hypothetical protein